MPTDAELAKLELLERTKEKFALEEKYKKFNEFRFEDIDASENEIIDKADLTVDQIPTDIKSKLVSASMFKDDLFLEAKKFTYNKDGTEGEVEERRTFIQLKYKPKATGSIDIVTIEQDNADIVEDYDTVEEKHKSVFTDQIVSSSAQRPRRKSFIKTNAVGGQVHKVLIQNKNPIQATLILITSASAS